jgi:hypothetical protein
MIGGKPYTGGIFQTTWHRRLARRAARSDIVTALLIDIVNLELRDDSRRVHARRARCWNQKGGPSPPLLQIRRFRVPGRSEAPPGPEGYFFLAFLAFFAFFAFFAFLAIVSSHGFNGLKRDTRGMLGGGPASQNPQA